MEIALTGQEPTQVSQPLHASVLTFAAILYSLVVDDDFKKRVYG